MSEREVAVEEREVEPDGWHEAIRAARDEGYAYFDWLSAVDEDPGLTVVCHLMDVDGPVLRRLLVRTSLAAPQDSVPSLASITDLFAGAAWHERETAEMFGLDFPGFGDEHGGELRPLLLPDGFEGHPLRKDFHLAARASKPWPGAKEPGEGEASTSKRSPSRRRLLPPGVPDPSWGPR